MSSISSVRVSRKRMRLVYSAAFIVALSAFLAPAAPARACPIPSHGAVVQTNEITSQSIVIFDLATGDETCEIDVPGYPLSVAVGANGMLYVAREPSKMTELTTDQGRLEVYTPDGRLIDERRDIPGVHSVRMAANRLLVSGGGSIVVRGGEVSIPPSLGLYDPRTLQLIRRFDVGSGMLFSAISSDGRYVAALYSGIRANHLQIFDAATGERMHDLALPNDGNVAQLMYRNDGFYVSHGRGAYSIDPASGSLRPAARMPDDGVQIVDGVRYAPENTPFVLPGQGTPTSKISRRRISDGAMLAPLIATGFGGLVGTFHGDRRLALRQPDPSVLPPALPSLQRIAQLANAPGMTFDERVSGRHYTIAGELALVDAPNEQKRYVVDCADGVEITEDTVTLSYAVTSMDPRPVAVATPSVQVSAGGRQYPVHYATQTQALTRSQLHSASATSGVRDVTTLGIANKAPMLFSESVTEFGPLPVAYPSCADRTFGGEPAPIDPMETAKVWDPPAAPRSSSIVYVSQQQGPTGLLPVVEIVDVRALDGAPASEFLPPANYTREKT